MRTSFRRLATLAKSWLLATYEPSLENGRLSPSSYASPPLFCFPPSLIFLLSPLLPLFLPLSPRLTTLPALPVPHIYIYGDIRGFSIYINWVARERQPREPARIFFNIKEGGYSSLPSHFSPSISLSLYIYIYKPSF